MNGMLTQYFYPLFWLALAVALAIAEAATIQLVAIWFSLGAAAAIIPALMGAPMWVQFLVFVAVSALAMALTRPILMKFLKVRKQSTNADRVIGQIGLVEQPIDNDLEQGRVSAMGLSWSARSEDGSTIPAGEKVVALSIEGVKLIVRRKAE